MYTILVNDSNELITSVKERIIQRSKLVDNLHILVAPEYKNYDMTNFVATMEYILPVSRELHTEVLTRSAELYKDMIEFKVPFDTALTKEAGDVELKLTFTSVEMNSDGAIQRVRKTTPTKITITASTDWCDIVPDEALSGLDQRLIMMTAMINAIDEEAKIIHEAKADNITYNAEDKYLQLSANGEPIGDRISTIEF